MLQTLIKIFSLTITDVSVKSILVIKGLTAYGHGIVEGNAMSYVPAKFFMERPG